MIHIGALVGAGLSQFKSDSIGINIGKKTYALFQTTYGLLRLF